MRAFKLSIAGALLSLHPAGAYAQDGIVCNFKTIDGYGHDGLAGEVESIAARLCNEFQSPFVRHESSKGIVLSITSYHENATFSIEKCTQHLGAISEQCIVKARVWGGAVEAEGLLYKIYQEHTISARGGSVNHQEHKHELEEMERRGIEARAKRAGKKPAKKPGAKKPVKPKNSKKNKPKAKKTKAKKTKTTKTKKTKTKTKVKTKAKTKTKEPISCPYVPGKGEKASLSARGNTQSGECEPKELPSIAAIENELKAGNNNCMFWSGVSGADGTWYRAAERGYQFGGYKTLSNLWKDPEWHTPYVSWPLKQSRKNDMFWEAASRAMANKCAGTVYVMLPQVQPHQNGRMWNADTIWDKIEWPVLVANPRVLKVIRLNPNSPDELVIKPFLDNRN